MKEEFKEALRQELPYDTGVYQIKPLEWNDMEALGVNHSYTIIVDPDVPFKVAVKYFSHIEQKGGTAPGFNQIWQAQRWANDHNRLKAMPGLQEIDL